MEEALYRFRTRSIMPGWTCDKCGRKNKGGTKACLCKRRIANVISAKPNIVKDCVTPPPREMCQSLDVCREKIVKYECKEFTERSGISLVVRNTPYKLPEGFNEIIKKLVMFETGYNLDDVRIRNKKRQARKKEKADLKLISYK